MLFFSTQEKKEKPETKEQAATHSLSWIAREDNLPLTSLGP
jgi:hypothetical protein